jgi:hypothetical protein
MINPKKNKPKTRQVSSEIKLLFFKKLLYICLGLLPLFFLINQAGPLRLVAGAGVLFALYQIILLIALSPIIVEEFFPSKHLIETNTKPFDRFISYACPVFFFLSAIFLVSEIREIDNTFHGTKLFWIAGGLGVLLAIILTAIIRKTNPSVYFEGNRRFTVHFSIFLGFFLLIPALANFINRTYSNDRETCSEYRVSRKDTGGARNKGYYLFIDIDGQNAERFEVTLDIFDNTPSGGTILLYTRNGSFGFRFVTGVETIGPQEF